MNRVQQRAPFLDCVNKDCFFDGELGGRIGLVLALLFWKGGRLTWTEQKEWLDLIGMTFATDWNTEEKLRLKDWKRA